MLDDDWNYNINNAGPKAARGGVFAPADIKLIKQALIEYVHNHQDEEGQTTKQVVNLLHRLNRIEDKS